MDEFHAIEFWPFAWEITKSVPGLLAQSFLRFEGWVMAAAFFVLLFNRKWGEKLLRWDGISLWWAFVPVGALLLFALVGANHEDREALRTQAVKVRDDLQNDLSEMQARVSDLQAELDSRDGMHIESIKPAFGQFERGGTTVTVFLSVANRGKPSIAKNWDLEIVFERESIHLRPFNVSSGGRKGVVLSDSRGRFVALNSEERWMVRLLGTQPLETGDMKSGFVIFWLEGVAKEYVTTHAKRLRLSFKDVYGNTHAHDYDLLDGIMYDVFPDEIACCAAEDDQEQSLKPQSKPGTPSDPPPQAE